MANVAKTDAQKAEAKAAREKTKVENFIRLANARVNNALAAIANVGGLANTATYSYTEAQITAIMKAFEAEVVKLNAKFSAPDTVKGAGFSLEAPVT